MNIDYSIFLIILGGFFVTWIPRILPFIFAKKMEFPPSLIKFLNYVPLCILAALLFQNLFYYHEHQRPDINWANTIAAIPTFLVAVKTKNLMKTVVAGVVAIAFLRLIIR